MKLPKALHSLLLPLALFICAAPAARSQNQAPAKPAAKQSAKPAKKSAAKPAAAAKSAPAAKSASAQPAAGEPAAEAPVAGKRDPFNPLVAEHKATAGGAHLPPGKAGLVVATVRVDGTVRSGDSMIAVVSNPEEHVYFVREGDRLYDGSVDKIALDGVTFRENSKDAFGKPVERVVTKRIYASAGEQQ